MKVKDLVAGLSKLDPNLEVVLQKDSEGNGYSPCAGFEPGIYVPDSTWSGEFHNPSDVEDEEISDINAIVLWPVN